MVNPNINHPLNHPLPICSMVLVYLPTVAQHKSPSFVGIPAPYGLSWLSYILPSCYPLVNCSIANWKITMLCSLGKLTISMAIFNHHVNHRMGAKPTPSPNPSHAPCRASVRGFIRRPGLGTSRTATRVMLQPCNRNRLEVPTILLVRPKGISQKIWPKI